MPVSASALAFLLLLSVRADESNFACDVDDTSCTASFLQLDAVPTTPETAAPVAVAIPKDADRVRGSTSLDVKHGKLDPDADNAAVKKMKFSKHKHKHPSLVSTDGGQSPYTETTTESWFDRMGDSFKDFAIGIVLLIFSVPILWVNERRNARMQSLIARGEHDVRTAKSTKTNEANEGTLVHVSDGSTNSVEGVSIKDIKGVEFKSGVLRVKTTTEICQWVEKESTKESKDNLGGGKTKKTSYSYKKEWTTTHHESSNFKDPKAKNEHHNPPKPDGLKLGVKTADCGKVEYGEAFLLPKELVEKMQNFKNANEALGTDLVAGKTFTKGDKYFESPAKGGKVNHKDPEVGDARILVEYVPDGEATIMALQAPCEKDPNRQSFLPYRLYSRGLCGMREDEEKRVALKEANKSTMDIAAEDKCTFGPLACLCCACNLVTMCFAAFTPEIYHIFPGKKTEKQCVNQITGENTLVTWIMRFIGWFLMFTGLYMLFSPILTFVDIIPFLGPLISTVGGWLIWIMCLLTTVAVSSLIVCVAYLAYRPLIALMWGALVAACVAVPLYVIPTLTETPP